VLRALERLVADAQARDAGEEAQPGARDAQELLRLRAAHLELGAEGLHLEQVDRIAVLVLLQLADGVVDLILGLRQEGEAVARELHAEVRLAHVEAHRVARHLERRLVDLHVGLGGVPQVGDLAEGPQRHHALDVHAPREAEVRGERRVGVGAEDVVAAHRRRRADAAVGVELREGRAHPVPWRARRAPAGRWGGCDRRAAGTGAGWRRASSWWWCRRSHRSRAAGTRPGPSRRLSSRASRRTLARQGLFWPLGAGGAAGGWGFGCEGVCGGL
jgi:hypothetical protein